MKKLLTYAATFIIALMPLVSLASAKQGPNLVSNPSVETVSSEDPNSPKDWVRNQWGNLDAEFSYLDEGFVGYGEKHSVRVDVSNYQDGDAKWHFNPVEVEAGKNYTYSSYYKSSASSEIVMQLIDGNGDATYQWLKTAESNSGDWKMAAASLNMPQGIVKATVLHVLNGNGYLQLDEIFFGLTDNTPLPPPSGDNLIPNNSMETPDSTDSQRPAFWNKNSWGNNSATFRYKTTGRDGSRSLETEITEHTDGDAKWFFDPVAIEGGQDYTFKEQYYSSTSTEFVLAFDDVSGNRTYKWVKTVGVGYGWSQLVVDFTAPADAEKVTVLHVVNRVGLLSIDNVQLTMKQTSANPVPNASLENSGGIYPAQWSYGSWGNNTPGFEWIQDDGHSGNKSVKVSLSDYQDGDAKWFFEPIDSLKPGERYSLEAWYKTNTTPKAVAQFNMSDGSTKYVGLPNPLPKSNSTDTWQHYSEAFTVPENTASTTMLFLISNNGWLQTDDYSIKPYTPAGFNRPLVTITFDDGEEDNVNTALPIMTSHGLKSTQCFATNHIEDNQEQVDRVLSFYDNGHEVCSHTVTHPFMTTLSTSELEFELSHSKEYLESITGTTVRNFASPYGDYNANVIAVIDNYYRSHRTVDEGYNSKDNFNIYRLRVQNMLDTTTIEEFQSWLDYAEATNTWLILVYHRVADTPGPYDTYVSDFEDQMNALKNSGLSVKTYNEALNEVVPQL